jgi:hypothetical protein
MGGCRRAIEPYICSAREWQSRRQELSVGDAGFQVGALGGNEHAYLGLIALDGQPLAASRQVLLVALGRAENQAMGWNATRTSVGNQWGSGPAVV